MLSTSTVSFATVDPWKVQRDTRLTGELGELSMQKIQELSEMLSEVILETLDGIDKLAKLRDKVAQSRA